MEVGISLFTSSTWEPQVTRSRLKRTIATSYIQIMYILDRKCRELRFPAEILRHLLVIPFT